MVVHIIWCVFITIRVNYPRQYPPLDRYTLIVIILFLINMLNMYINKLYEPKKEYLLINIIRNILMDIPLLYAFILYWVI